MGRPRNCSGRTSRDHPLCLDEKKDDIVQLLEESDIKWEHSHVPHLLNKTTTDANWTKRAACRAERSLAEDLAAPLTKATRRPLRRRGVGSSRPGRRRDSGPCRRPNSPLALPPNPMLALALPPYPALGAPIEPEKTRRGRPERAEAKNAGRRRRELVILGGSPVTLRFAALLQAAMDYRPPNGFLSFLQDQRHPDFTFPANQQLGFQYPMFPMMPPPPAANHHPFPFTSDPRITASPSGKRKQVTIDVEANDLEKQRLYYTKDEDIRLVSAWLRNSVNPIEGNAKKGEYYWKEVVDAYNSTTESDRKRDIKHLKNHWYKTTPKVTSFNGCYNQIRDTYASGSCDTQHLQQALDLYHSRNGHQFMYVHWWEAVKDSQKWKIHVYTEGDGTKRSSPGPTEKTPRPMGCKAAKKARGKEKEAPAEINGERTDWGFPTSTS